MTRFSIVVPAHNVESYIMETLESIKRQSFRDFEVICVDDCSTDRTRGIIEGFCEKDERFKLVVNEENLQLYATRHVGTALTSGEYVLYVDGDDALTINALEMINERLMSNPVDILQFGMKVILDEGIREARKNNVGDTPWYEVKYGGALFEGRDIARHICYEYPFDMCMHHRAIKGRLARMVFADLGLEPNLYASEDITELTALMLNARSYQILECGTANYYVYYLGRGMSNVTRSMTREEFERWDDAKLRCYKALMRYIDGNGLHRLSTDEAIAWRWRLACMQSMSTWRNKLAISSRLDVLRRYAEHWPLEWFLPMVLQYTSDAASALIEDGSSNLEALEGAWRELVDLLRCLGMLYEKCDRNPVRPEETSMVWRLMLEGVNVPELFDAGSDEQKETVNFLLNCVRGLCLFHRNETWLMDDRATHWKGELDELVASRDALQTDYDEVIRSKSFKLGNAIAAPIRFLNSLKD